MATRIAALSLAITLTAIVVILATPGLDRLIMLPQAHFYAVSAASLLAAAICAALVISARSIRETRILFLALCFFSLGIIFSIHGLTTPGQIYEYYTAALERSPWLSTLAAGFFATLSVISVPRFMERTRLRLPEITFALCAGLVILYFLVSLAYPNWLEGFPTREDWFRRLLTVVTIGLLSFAAWRYYQSYLFTRLPSQLAVMVGLLFLAEAQISLDLGQPWYLSWWIYHGLFLVAFASVLLGFAWEMHRAKDVKAIAEALVMRDALVQLNRGRPASAVSLADQIENHDRATSRHTDRVASYAYAIGQQLAFGPARLRQLVLAAQMHDIGKIGLPSYILQKSGKLTPEEFSIIQQHPGKGYEIIRRAKGLEAVAGAIRHHHERFDGSGYPDGLAGEAIPLESRIIAAADTFDAVTSKRPYRAAMTQPDAEAELRRVSGTQLDPACVQAMLAVLHSQAPSGDGSPGPVRPRLAPRLSTPSSELQPKA